MRVAGEKRYPQRLARTVLEAEQTYNRLVLAGDINHRPRLVNPEYRQLFSSDPKDFKALGERWLATDKHQATGGYELQVYDVCVDGLVFMRVFGGIGCYDLRVGTK